MSKKNKTCEQCINCMYVEHGDMYCDEHEDFAFVYDEFCPTNDYMWCGGKKFEEIKHKNSYKKEIKRLENRINHLCSLDDCNEEFEL